MSKKSSRARRARIGAGALNQLTYPKAIRIQQPTDSPDNLERLEMALQARAAQQAPHLEPPTAADEDLLRIVALAGVGLWRIRQKLVRPGTDEPIDGAQRALRHVQALWDGLAEAGVKILDHTGEVLPEGRAYSISVLGFQPTAGATREVVLETIKPTVYYRDKMVQIGEVIVATPEGSESGASS
ncbi:MAG: hypothetical protein M0000_12870 [Actinomycetota bacterium]|nr:hypothetical protein [Actinomycetota bacterium]